MHSVPEERLLLHLLDVNPMQHVPHILCPLMTVRATSILLGPPQLAFVDGSGGFAADLRAV